MKKILVTLAATALALSVYAQGTVTFQNAVGVGGKVYIDGALATASDQFTVQLLYGPVGTALDSLTPWTDTFTSTTGMGLFYDGATKTLPGIPAGGGSADSVMNVTLAIQGWTGAWATMEEAIANNALVGKTLAFNNPTGAGGAPPSPPANMVGWLADNPLNLTAIPEPSTFALLGLGALGMFLFRGEVAVPCTRKPL